LLDFAVFEILGSGWCFDSDVFEILRTDRFFMFLKIPKTDGSLKKQRSTQHWSKEILFFSFILVHHMYRKLEVSFVF
jgi:hypothetical protein